MNHVLIGLTLFLSVLTFAGLYRAYVGPTAADRVVAINVTATKVTVIIVLIAVVTAQDTYVN
ncbi:MAG: cation:proton antiporter, partial [Acholeplasmatales bacterium]